MGKPVTTLPPEARRVRGRGRRAEYSAATKRELTDVAEGLFTEHGYAGTSLDAIVAGARVTKGALYHHFTGKQALFAAVFERVERRASLVVHEQVKDEQDPWEQARAGLRAFLVVVRDPTYRRVVIQDGPAVLGYERYREQEERSTFATVLAIVTSLLAIGRPATGDPVADEPMRHTFARIFFGAMSSAGESVSLAEDPEAAADRVEAAIGLVLTGLRSLAQSQSSAQSSASSGETPTSAR
jgi:AcrR family transcriptional regulator